MCFHSLRLYELGHGKKMLISTSFQCFYLNINFHYEKSCMWKLHYLATKCFKQLMCNYVAIIPWKYRELKVMSKIHKNLL
jgi:hypothetical protein